MNAIRQRSLSVSTVAAGALLLALALPARSQTPPGGGGLPSPQEVERRVAEELERIPDQTSEIEGATLTYKPIPTDPAAALRASGQVPPGVDPDQIAKRYGHLIQPTIERTCARLGKLVLGRPARAGSKALPAGEYTFGLVVRAGDLAPVAVTIGGGSLKTPVQIPIKPGKPPSAPHETARLEIKPGKKPGEFTIAVAFGRVEGEAGKFSFTGK